MAQTSPSPTALTLAAVLTAAAPMVAAAAVAPATNSGDQITGTPLNEVIHALVGNDTVRGMDGDDQLYGNAGDDSLGGGPGEDLIHGGQGDDRINGGQGNDTLGGDLGNDTLAGGLGADIFAFDVGAGDDVIEDFSPSDGDKILLPNGYDYRIVDTDQGVVIRSDAGGSILVRGLRFTALGDNWKSGGAPAVSLLPPHLATVADPPPGPSKTLLGVIIGLGVALVLMLGVGLAQLWRGGRDGRG